MIETIPNSIIITSNGKFFKGFSVGSKNKTIGEACFNTSITGYQESITDPSYTSQILIFTFPHIGNNGINIYNYEKDTSSIKGVVMRERILHHDNHRSKTSFADWLNENKITGIYGIDTRALTKILVNNGANNFMIAPYNKDTDIKALHNELILHTVEANEDLSILASTKKIFDWTEDSVKKTPTKNNLKIAVIDFGIKLSILRTIYKLGCDVRVFPSTSKIEEIKQYKPNGIILSNGPGNPIESFETLKTLMHDIVSLNIPIFGICFGHQLIALTFGASIHKMHHGHRSTTHPVIELSTNKVYLTSQNHGFAINKNSLNKDITITHESLLDGCIEGIKINDKKIFSVQYHPESAPGPNDSMHMFTEFIEMMEH